MDSEYLELEDHVITLIKTESITFNDLDRLLTDTRDVILGVSREGSRTIILRINSLEGLRQYVQERKRKGAPHHFLSIRSSTLEQYLEIDRVYKLGRETDMYMRAEEETRAEAAKYPLGDVPGLSVRAILALQRNHIGYVVDVLTKTLEEILCLRNFGEVSFNELVKSMAELGYEAQQDEGNEPLFHKAKMERIVIPITEDELFGKNEPE
jgi:hypothetical protein